MIGISLTHIKLYALFPGLWSLSARNYVYITVLNALRLL